MFYVCVFFTIDPSKSFVMDVERACSYTQLLGTPPIKTYRVSQTGSYESCKKELEEILMVIRKEVIGTKLRIVESEDNGKKCAYLEEAETSILTK